MRAISANVHGRVQGVGFRITTVRVAQNLGVAGWVRNTAGGSVEVFAQGDDGAVNQFLSFLRTGPRGAQVTSVEIDEAVPSASLTGFGVRY